MLNQITIKTRQDDKKSCLVCLKFEAYGSDGYALLREAFLRSFSSNIALRSRTD